MGVKSTQTKRTRIKWGTRKKTEGGNSPDTNFAGVEKWNVSGGFQRHFLPMGGRETTKVVRKRAKRNLKGCRGSNKKTGEKSEVSKHQFAKLRKKKIPVEINPERQGKSKKPGAGRAIVLKERM